ncbi:MAG: AsmA family protein [Desulfovibrio sp.]
MRFFLKVFVSIILILGAVFGGGFIAASSYIDSPEFKDMVLSELEKKLGVEVAADDLDLTVYPWLGGRIEKVVLSEGGREPFLTIEELGVALQLPSLLEKEIVLNKIILIQPKVFLLVNGNSTEVERMYESLATMGRDTSRKDNTLSSLLGVLPIPKMEEFRLKILGAEVQKGSFQYLIPQDSTAKTSAKNSTDNSTSGFFVNNINIETGPISPIRPISVRANGNADSTFGGSPLMLNVSGMINLAKLDTSRGITGGRFSVLTDVKVVDQRFPLEIHSGVSFDPTKKALGLADCTVNILGMNLNGDLDILMPAEGVSVSGFLHTEAFNGRTVLKQMFPKEKRLLNDLHPKALSTIVLSSGFSYKADQINLSPLRARIDDTVVNGVVGYDLQKEKFNVHLKGGTLNLDKFLAVVSSGKNGKNSGANTGGVSSKKKDSAEESPLIKESFSTKLKKFLETKWELPTPVGLHDYITSHAQGEIGLHFDRFRFLEDDYRKLVLRVSRSNRQSTLALSAQAVKGGVFGTNMTFGHKHTRAGMHIAVDGHVDLKKIPSRFVQSYLPSGMNFPNVVTARFDYSLPSVILKEKESLGVLLADLQTSLLVNTSIATVAGLNIHKSDSPLVDDKAEAAFKNFSFRLKKDKAREGDWPITAKLSAESAQGTGSFVADMTGVLSLPLERNGYVLKAARFSTESFAAKTHGFPETTVPEMFLDLSSGVIRGDGAFSLGDGSYVFYDSSAKVKDVSGNYLQDKPTVSGLLHATVPSIKALAETLKISLPVSVGEEYYNKADLDTRFSYSDDCLQLDKIRSNIDISSIKGAVTICDFSNPRYKAALEIDKLNIDGYLPIELFLSDEEEAEYEKQHPGVELGDSFEEEANRDPNYETPLPLELIRSFDVDLKLDIKDMRIYYMHFDETTAHIVAKQGDIKVDPVRTVFYEGKGVVKLFAQASEEEVKVQCTADVDKTKFGPFIEALAGYQYVRGTTSGNAEYTSHGKSWWDLLENWSGTNAVTVKDGSYRFSTPTDDPDKDKAGRTRFGECALSMKVDKGVFYNPVSSFSSPLISVVVDKKSKFSIPDNSIDVAFDATIAAVPRVTIYLEGELTDPQVKIPSEEILTGTVKQILTLPQRGLKKGFDTGLGILKRIRDFIF